MHGKLYGIGTGPGDPQLLTLKAVETIQNCSVLAVPKTSNDERTAFSIIEKYTHGKEILECRFTMEKDTKKREAARLAAAADIMGCLEDGKDVGFVTLGDPTTYSTYMYVHKIIVGKGYFAEIIPGVTSYSAAAAALGIPLCEGNEILTIIPARHNADMDRLLDYPGNKVIMKSGANLAHVLGLLEERGYGERTRIACRVTMESQKLYNSIEDFDKSPEKGYFTTVIVKEEI
jgi:precorrin-2/cobalt-factor-2 C20-methyltransferase